MSSTVLEIELSRNRDLERRRDAAVLLLFAEDVVVPELAEADRARQLVERGFGSSDALHLASAERGGVDVFLTTDDDLLRCARRNPGLLHISVENPVSWYQGEQ